ncbi:embryo-specific protein [Glomus cerebriforme]|uniref:Embryo-specific protein n=1 Tax=Glomus cerebriforme TaxID=658196 RepID=A0A397TGV1_9GLOM|nr:embryo-specific protein [Glomus cerebriforme]
MVQNFDPIKNFHEHVCGFHFYSHDMNRQVEAHHYCSHLNPDVRQCVIYDSDKSDARLIGVEYIISAKLFQTLPEEEKKYWHSHVYEIKSGMLILPTGSLVPTVAVDKVEETALEELIKTWHFWQVDAGHPLPYGPPQLMMAFVDDNQLSQSALDDRDKRYNVSTAYKRQVREVIHPKYSRDVGADHWVTRDDGKAYQVEMRLVEQKKIDKK